VAKREPSPQGLGLDEDVDERRRCGTLPRAATQPDFALRDRGTTLSNESNATESIIS